MMSNADIDSSGSDDDYIEEPYVDTSLEGVCLFCNHTEADCDQLLFHLKTSHSVDLLQFCGSNELDSISYIKLINYIRHSQIGPNHLDQILKQDEWRKDDYMKPVRPNDMLLTLDIEGDSDEDDLGVSKTIKTASQPNKETLLQEELNKLRSLLSDLGDQEEPRTSHQNMDHEDYFSSYSHHSIHWEMLSDRPRTESYRQAILSNKEMFNGSSCLDIGCGTGILSLFAFEAGAGKIVAVDQSEIIYSAMDIAQENGAADSIEFKKGKLEDLELNEKFDFIISEWMGYFLLFEGMLDTVIVARDKYLRPGGAMLPGGCSIFMAALSDEKLYGERVTFWNNVYGFKMSSMKRDVLNEVLVREVSNSSLISDSFEVKSFDLKTCTLSEAQNVYSHFHLTANSSGTVHGLVFWFDCYFDGSTISPTITLSTSPHSQVTHWKQSVLFLKKPIQVSKGDSVKGKIELTRGSEDFRALKIQLTVDGQGVQRYLMN